MIAGFGAPRTEVESRLELYKRDLIHLLGEPLQEEGMAHAPRLAWYRPNHTITLDAYWSVPNLAVLMLGVELKYPGFHPQASAPDRPGEQLRPHRLRIEPSLPESGLDQEQHMDLGPVEVVIFTFPQPEVDPGVIAALGETVRGGAVTLIDLVLVTRDGEGKVHIRDIEDDLPEAWADVLIDSRPLTLLSESDLDVAAESVGKNETAVVAAFEHKWAQPLSAEVRRAGGTTALHVRIPRETVDAALEASDAAG